jgi:hypothetical protein
LVTLSRAVLEGIQASAVLLALIGLTGAVVSDTLFGGEQREGSHCSLIASVGLSTLGDVNGGLTSLAGETESPAAG